VILADILESKYKHVKTEHLKNEDLNAIKELVCREFRQYIEEKYNYFCSKENLEELALEVS